jgi:hypothetical protein
MRMLYSLYILNFITKRFKHAERAPTTGEISDRLGVPLNVSRILVENMQKCDLIAETIEGPNKDHGYVPALDISHLTMSFVINKLESYGSLKRIGNTDVLHQIKVHYNDLEAAMHESSSNKNITDF